MEVINFNLQNTRHFKLIEVGHQRQRKKKCEKGSNTDRNTQMGKKREREKKTSSAEKSPKAL